MMKLNEAQEKAITTIDRNLAVNAGAGTGKTKVLTERYVYILEHGDLEENKEIESIVAITFTKKATQEMIERIRLEVKKNFNKDNKWRRYYRDLEQANISTIHSFCGKILRENPIEANIDPLFQVLEDDRAAKLLKGSIIEVLNESLEKNYDFFKLMSDFNVNRTESLVDDFYSVYNNIRTVGLDFQSVKSITMSKLEGLKIDNKDLEAIKNIIIYLSENIGKASKLSKMVINEDPVWLKFFAGEYDTEDLYSIIEYLESNLGSSSKEPEHFQRLRNSIANVLKTKDMESKYLFLLVLDLLIAIDLKYEEFKRNLAVLDYDDLQIKVLKLLDNENIRSYYQKKFKYFMIDEFQDTNELQRKIFYKLTSDKDKLDQDNLFIVGDPKQSIYGFRGSDIDVFYETIKDIKSKTKEDPISMNNNYRTSQNVLDFINIIFSSIMGEKYDSLIANKIHGNSLDIEILDNSDYEKYPELKASEAASIYEANLIAKRIKTLVDKGKFHYGDFSILFRSTTRNYIYEDALKNYNIPYFNSSSKRFFARQEILDIINALKVISNPNDNIATIGLLRSPMVGISDNTLYYILKNRNKSVYESILDLDYSAITFEDQTKIKESIAILNYFYEIKDIYTISRLTEDLIDKTYFIETTLLKINGKQSMANIYKFMEIVKSYEENNKNSLEDFIDYIEEIKIRDEAEATIESEDSNVVKLLTIHKSKGLEFPVVIIPEMSRDSGGRLPNLIFNKNLGLGIKTVKTSGLYDEIKNILRIKDDEEKERVLYVAMTRAEKMLILGNQGRNSAFKKLISELLDKVEYRTISNVDLEMQARKNIKLIDENLLHSNDNKNEFLVPLLFNSSINKKFESYSISQFLVFNQCRRKYYMDYYHGRIESYRPGIEQEIKKEIMTPVDIGNIIHKFAQLYNSNLDTDTLLNDVLTSLALSNIEDNKLLLMPYINNYLKAYKEDYDQVFLERAFHIKIGDNYLNGVIDRINIKDNIIEIQDLKTNKVKDKNGLIHQYTPQLQIYAYAVEKIMNMPVEKASILFLETGELVDISLKAEELLSNVENIKAFIDYVENHSEIDDYSKSINCGYCKYKTICF